MSADTNIECYRELGEINSTLQGVQGSMSEIKYELGGIRKDINQLCVDNASMGVILNTHQEDIKSLKTRSNVWDFFNSVGVVIAAIWSAATRAN